MRDQEMDKMHDQTVLGQALRDRTNKLLAVYGALAMALSFAWFDMPGHGSAFIEHDLAMSTAYADGHTLFLLGMLAMVLLEAAFPRWFEDRRRPLLAVNLVLSTAAVAVFCAPVPLGVSAAAVVLIGFTNLHLLTTTFTLLAYVFDRAVLNLVVAALFAFKTLLMWLADTFLSAGVQTGLLIALPALSIAFAFAACHTIDEDARMAFDVRIRFEKPLSTAMLGMLLVSSVIFAVTRVVSNMGFWGTRYALTGLSPVVALLGTAVFLAVCYVTLVRTNAQLLFRFLPGLLVLFVVYAFLYAGVLGQVGVPDNIADVVAQYAELYGETFVWIIMLFAIRTLKMPPYRVVGLQFALFTVIELVLQLYMTRNSQGSLVVVLLGFFGVFAVLIWALFHFYGMGNQFREARCAQCAHKFESTGDESLPGRVAGGVDASGGEPVGGCGAAGHAARPEIITMTSADQAGTGGTAEDPRRALAMRYELSDRETDVFLLLAQGRNRRFICNELFIADGTASTYISRVYEKFGVHSKQELLSIVLEATDGA